MVSQGAAFVSARGKTGEERERAIEIMAARTRFEGQAEKLDRLVTEGAGGGRVAVDGRNIYVRLPGRPDGGDFVLRVRCGEYYPIFAPSYTFVDPATLEEGGREFWPDDGHGMFKTHERPPWVCLPGTFEYWSNHSYCRYDPWRDSICQTVFHISRRIASGEDGRP